MSDKKRKLRNLSEELEVLEAQIDSLSNIDEHIQLKNELTDKRLKLIDNIFRVKAGGDGDHEEEKQEENKENGDDEEMEYEVEKILDVKTSRGRRKFLVKWKGWAHESNTWEPEEHMASCPDKIKEFYRKKRDQNGDKPSNDDEDDDFLCDGDGKKVRNKVEEEAFSEAFKTKLEEFYTSTGFPPMVDLPHRIDDVKLESLKARSWISNFVMDDFICILLDKFGIFNAAGKLPGTNLRISYLSHAYFTMVLSTNQYCSESFFKYIYSHNLLMADIILVLTSTAYGQEVDGSADHWMLGIIHKDSQSVYLLDSYETDACVRSETFLSLATIVHAMYEVENMKTPLLDWSFIYSNDCLEQTNNFDCGLHVCMNTFGVIKGIRPGKVPSGYGRKFMYNVLKNGTVKQPPVVKDPENMTLRNEMSKIKHNTWAKIKDLKENIDIELKPTNDFVFKLCR